MQARGRHAVTIFQIPKKYLLALPKSSNMNRTMQEIERFDRLFLLVIREACRLACLRHRASDQLERRLHSSFDWGLV